MNIPDILSVNAMRDELLRRRIDGRGFDKILHLNTLCSELEEVWPDMHPATAVLIRKLWHNDFYPSRTGQRLHKAAVLDDRSLSHRPPPLELDDMANVVRGIVDVMSPSCSIGKEQIFDRISPILPKELDNLVHPPAKR